MSRNVTYSRGTNSLTIPAIVGRTAVDVDTTVGSQRIVSVDFLIDAADLTFGDPAAGDLIALSGDTYEVRELPGIGLWEQSGGEASGKLRIHTKAQ
jgi:hypothetical protein